MTVVPSMSYALEKHDKNGDILTVNNFGSYGDMTIMSFYNTGPWVVVNTAMECFLEKNY